MTEAQSGQSVCLKLQSQNLTQVYLSLSLSFHGITLTDVYFPMQLPVQWGWSAQSWCESSAVWRPWCVLVFPSLSLVTDLLNALCWPLSISFILWFYSRFSSVQSLSHVRLFVTPWIAAHQAPLSITNSRSSPKLMSIKSVMLSSHLILCRPLLFLPPIPLSIRVFSNESGLHIRWPKYLSFSFSISPSNEHSR